MTPYSIYLQLATISEGHRETKYMLLSHPQNAGQNHEIKIATKSFENVAQFKYLGMTVTNQNLILGEIKSRPNSGNAFYHSQGNGLIRHGETYPDFFFTARAHTTKSTVKI
jgi:hypothetical protein